MSLLDLESSPPLFFNPCLQCRNQARLEAAHRNHLIEHFPPCLVLHFDLCATHPDDISRILGLGEHSHIASCLYAMKSGLLLGGLSIENDMIHTAVLISMDAGFKVGTGISSCGSEKE